MGDIDQAELGELRAANHALTEHLAEAVEALRQIAATSEDGDLVRSSIEALLASEVGRDALLARVFE